MLKDFECSKTVEEVKYQLGFYNRDWGCGYGFPCDEHKNVKLEELETAAIENYEWCMSHPDDFKYFAVLDKTTHRYRKNASGICSCGERIELYDEYLGACECPYCGKWYNLFGQEVNHPSTWANGEDW